MNSGGLGIACDDVDAIVCIREKKLCIVMKLSRNLIFCVESCSCCKMKSCVLAAVEAAFMQDCRMNDDWDTGGQSNGLSDWGRQNMY